MGGIPTKPIRYDNLTIAVTAVEMWQGRQRREDDRWVFFLSCYGFDPFIASLASQVPTKGRG